MAIIDGLMLISATGTYLTFITTMFSNDPRTPIALACVTSVSIISIPLCYWLRQILYFKVDNYQKLLN